MINVAIVITVNRSLYSLVKLLSGTDGSGLWRKFFPTMPLLGDIDQKLVVPYLPERKK